MAWTYDISTDRGKTRQLLRDVDRTNQIFSDAEVDGFLLMAHQLSAWAPGESASLSELYEAAAIGWEIVSGDASKLAVIEKIAIFSDNTVVTAVAIKDEADRLRKRSCEVGLPGVTPNDPVVPLKWSTDTTVKAADGFTRIYQLDQW